MNGKKCGTRIPLSLNERVNERQMIACAIQAILLARVPTAPGQQLADEERGVCREGDVSAPANGRDGDCRKF